MSNKWTTKGFEGFRAGTFGNGGQNLYVSKQGVLQRIHQTDVTRNGYVDLVFCNSQSHEEKVPLDVYDDPVSQDKPTTQLYIGGAISGCVTDLNGNGYDDLIISCIWDGMTQVTNSVIFYGSAEGLNNKYVNYLPTERATCVAAGDFNGNGRKDLVFCSEKNMKIFYQGINGFEPENVTVYEYLNAENITAIPATGTENCDSLLIRKTDGSYYIVKGSPDGIDIKQEKLLLEADDNYVPKRTGTEGYNQAIKARHPLVQILTFAGTMYLCAFRKQHTLLYPYYNGELGTPIKFNCENAYAAAAGNTLGTGQVDLAFACRDLSTHEECSWLYPGNTSGKWNESDRIALRTCNACDVQLHDFTGNGIMDIVICQCHTHESYTSESLVLTLDNAAGQKQFKQHFLTTHDAGRIFIVNGQLVVSNLRSGSLIGDADATVYIGDSDGFKSSRKLELPAWGCTDMVCCDLNDNGFPDLVFANAAELSPWLDPGSFVYYNSAQGFAPQPDIKLPTTRAHGVAVGDLNHNGFLDLVFVGFDNKTIKVFYGSENGFSTENSQEIVMEENGKIHKEPRFLALADLNGNGWLDLIVPIINEYESFVLWGGPDGFSFDNKQVFHVRHACNAKVADLNGNGYPDLIFGGHSQSLSGAHDAFVYIYWGSADGYREDRRTLLPSNAVNSLAVADFNNDGLLDMFVASYQDGRLRDIDSHIYWNQGDDGFLPHKRLPMRTHAVSGNLAADFNGNGWIDLVVANHKVEGNHIAYSTVWHNGPEGFREANVTDLPTSGPHGCGNVDPGNIMDRSWHEYYISTIYASETEIALNQFYCEGEIPVSSEVAIQFRFGNTEAELLECPWRGALGFDSWFKPYQTIDSYRFKGKYFQYRLRLSSYNAVSTPRITAVIIETIR